MLGFFKNLIGERGQSPATPVSKETKEPSPAAPAVPSAPSTSTPASAPVESAPVPHLTPTPAPAGGYRPKPKMERVLLPLKGITDVFPADLQPLVAHAPAASVIIALSIEIVLEQLESGRVAVSLAELRRISPANIFAADTTRDQEKIEIPLDLLVEKLDPSVLPRNFQRRVEVPREIDPVFNRQGAAKPEAASPSAQQKQAAQPLPPKQTAPPQTAPPAQDAKKRSGYLAASPDLQELLNSHLKPSPPEPPPVVDPVPAPVSPKMKVEPVREVPRPVAPQPAVPAPRSSAPAAPVSAPPSVIKLSVKQPSPMPLPRQPVIDAPGVRRPGAPVSAPQAGDPLSIAARLKSAPPASEIAASVVVQLPLAEVSKSWPETIREELEGAPPDSAIHYPAPELGAALRSGKVQVAWKQLRLWIRPPLKKPADPLYTDALVELPLPIVAPRFMAAAAPGRSIHQVVVNEQIPTPFARTAPPTPPPAPPKVEPAPAPKGVSAPEPIVPAANRVGALGLDGKLPTELIDRACQLAGVAGAVIALKEGLVVASKLPPEMKPDTLGAFLPQLFSRVEQSIGSMEIGDLQSLQFIAGDRPWQIWSAGPVLFAAVGRPNELLPGAQLKIIAAQLARQTKG